MGKNRFNEIIGNPLLSVTESNNIQIQVSLLKRLPTTLTEKK